jgi:hypothetical protein
MDDDLNLQVSSYGNNSNETARQRSELITKWLLTLSAAFPPKDLSDGALFPIWTMALSDLSLPMIQSAFVKLISNFKPTSACPFPVPGNLREQIDSVNSAAEAGKVELAWQKALEYRRRFYDADKPGQLSTRAPALSQRMQNACRASGVLTEITEADQLHVWGKKRFIESYLNWEILEMNQHLLPEGPVKDAITQTAQSMAPGTAKQITAPTPIIRPIDQRRPVAGPIYIPEAPPLTDYQIEQRKELLRRQAEELKAKYS